jgi:DNA (cytosine-5)-methyltransferase 1
MVVADCGVEISGPLSARDYKDAGTDGMNKISAKMIPVMHETVGALCADTHPGAYSGQDAYTGRLIPQAIPLNTMTMQGRPSDDGRMGSGIGEPGDPCPTLTKAHSHAAAQPTYAIQGSMIGRNDNAGPQGDGINEEVCFTQNTIDRHAVAQPIAFEPGKLKRLGLGYAQPNVSHALRAEAGDNQIAVATPMAVRRLTPTECERLQGFPDGYTNIPWRKAAESPDGPRYKALGNSWAVPVVRWIGKRIQERITT